MSIPKLEINQLVEIIVPEGEVYAGKYKSRVEEITDTEIKLAMPFKDGELIPLRVGSVIGVEQFTPAAIFVHHTAIKERVSSPVPLIVVGKPHSVTKIQRRNFLRWETRLAVVYRVHDENQPQASNLVRTYTRDISGGGTLIEVPEALPPDTILELEVTLPKAVIRAMGRVCRSFEAKTDEDAKTKQILAALEFFAIDERSRDKIVNYIFDQQRELRKKGLI